MSDQNTDASGLTPLATSYHEALKSTAARRVSTDGDWPGTPLPDTPRGAVHLNPALTPAPDRVAPPERFPVPVVNDPGVVGSGPSLADLNRAYRDDLGVLQDDTMGVTVQNQREAITEAAQIRQDDIAQQAQERADKAISEAQAVSDQKPVDDKPAEKDKPAPKSEPKKS